MSANEAARIVLFAGAYGPISPVFVADRYPVELVFVAAQREEAQAERRRLRGGR